MSDATEPVEEGHGDDEAGPEPRPFWDSDDMDCTYRINYDQGKGAWSWYRTLRPPCSLDVIRKTIEGDQRFQPGAVVRIRIYKKRKIDGREVTEDEKSATVTVPPTRTVAQPLLERPASNFGNHRRVEMAPAEPADRLEWFLRRMEEREQRFEARLQALETGRGGGVPAVSAVGQLKEMAEVAQMLGLNVGQMMSARPASGGLKDTVEALKEILMLGVQLGGQGGGGEAPAGGILETILANFGNTIGEKLAERFGPQLAQVMGAAAAGVATGPTRVAGGG